MTYLRSITIWPSSVLLLLCFLSGDLLAQSVTPWLTRGDQSVLLTAQSGVSFGNPDGNVANEINLDETTTFQTFSGAGFALTQGSAEVISGLNNGVRANLLNDLFDPVTGNAISMIRISIGASDLSNSVYTYNEVAGDVHMINCSLAGPDQTFLIPVIKEILAINPTIKIIATPWTAPTWMKTNNSWIGGSLSNAYYSAYASYFVKYLQAMQSEGINIWAITPQNEPENPNNEPSMSMTSAEQKNFINNHLGPAMANAGFNTKIIAFDHNCDNTAYPIDVANNSSYVDGSAFHLYAGDISAMSTVQNQTGKNVYFTEQFTSSNGNFSGDLAWHMENVVVGSMRNWSKTVIEWNLASDQNFGPRTPGGCTECLGAVTINNSTSFTKNVSYYIISQVTKFLAPGAERIGTNNLPNLPNVAFRNTDGSYFLLVYNKQNQDQTIRVNNGTGAFDYNVPGRSAITFQWNGTSSPPATKDPYQQIEAENYNDSFGVQLENTNDTGGGQNVGFTDDGDYIRFNNVDFGNGAQSVSTRIASNASFTGQIEYRLNGVNGPLISSVNVGNTGGWQTWTTRITPVSGANGINDLYVVFKGGNGIGNLNWFTFATGSSVPAAPSSLSASAGGTSSVFLSWNDNSVDEDLFSVQRSPSGSGNWSTVATLPANTTNYTNTGLTAATIYFYRVRAENQTGSSSWSQTVSATTNPVSSGIVDGTVYRITNSGSGKTIDVAGVSLNNGATIQQWIYTGGDNQHWRVESTGTGEYRLTAIHSGKVLDVVNGATNNNAGLQQWDDFGSSNQRWKIVSTGNNAYRIVSAKSNKSLDISSNSNSNGATLIQNTTRTDAYQQWQFIPVSANRSQLITVVTGQTDRKVNLFPNPATDVISLTGKSVSYLQIIDQAGRVILQADGDSGTTTKLDISALQNGIYILQSTLIDGSGFTASFVKH
ncbi:MAG: RICIN domain-containing protein [Cyclobacteriaceae bacterium]